MDIVLAYIEGISRVDTPYFTSGSEQWDYFIQHEVETISTTFYPPHYENKIRFDIADINFNSQVNYLWFIFNGKRYYYFIDNITYINENLVELDVSMDYIQTYMFNIYIQSGIIERKFINRWNQDDTINRNYIRENVSNNEFVITSKEYINLDTSKYVLFVKQSKVDKGNSYANWAARSTVSYFTDVGVLSTKMPYAFTIPYDLKFGPGSAYGFIKDDANKVSSMTPLIATGSYLAETLDMYVCPFNPFVDINISSPVSGNCTLTGNVTNTDYINFDDMHGETVYYNKAMFDSYHMKIERGIQSFDFNVNIDLDIPYDSKYIIQMLDNNYIRYTFGTSACCTTYPLYVSKYKQLYYNYAFDPTNGTRIYFINSPYDDNPDDDIYNTMVIDTNIISVDLKNDPWANYIANNKNRWAQITNNAAADVSRGMLSFSGSGNKIGKIGTISTKDTKISYKQARNKKGQFTNKVRRTGSSTTSSTSNVYGEIPSEPNYSGVASSLISAGESIVNQYYTEKNLLSAPAGISQLGELVNSFISQEHLIYSCIEKVIDYEQCALYYHRNGYLVNEMINGITNIFRYVQNRYYFNVLKLGEVDLHLHNVIEDENTIQNIIDRLNDGIRLWRTQGRSVTSNIAGTASVGYQTIDLGITAADTLVAPHAVLNPADSTLMLGTPHLENDRWVVRLTNLGITPRIYGITFTYTKIPITIGDFTYDNIELKYVI